MEENIEKFDPIDLFNNTFQLVFQGVEVSRKGLANIYTIINNLDCSDLFKEIIPHGKESQGAYGEYGLHPDVIKLIEEVRKDYKWNFNGKNDRSLNNSIKVTLIVMFDTYISRHYYLNSHILL